MHVTLPLRPRERYLQRNIFHMHWKNYVKSVNSSPYISVEFEGSTRSKIIFKMENRLHTRMELSLPPVLSHGCSCFKRVCSRQVIIYSHW